MQLCTIAELRKKKWNSQCCATLWQGDLHKVTAPYFCFIYIVQLYKEYWGILHLLGCSSPQYQANSRKIEELKGDRKRPFSLMYDIIGRLKENVLSDSGTSEQDLVSKFFNSLWTR